MELSESAAQGRALATQPSRSTAPIPAADIRAQLARILASRPFARSERIRRFLEFAVEHSLSGSAEGLKEYRVGVEVFDRKHDYDPRVDPIVRVEARRLRTKLRSYYTTAGKVDGVIIDIPKGAYLPVFRLRSAKRAAPPRHAAGPSIAVLPFANLTPEAGDEYFAEGLAEELNLLLTRVESLRVVALHSTSQLRHHDPRSIGDRLKVDHVLKGAVRRTSEQVRVTVQLLDAKTGSMLWSEAYTRKMSGLLALEEEIARAIAGALRTALGTAVPELSVRAMPNLECYNLCLEGRFHANKRSAPGLRKSAECYALAIEKDPCAIAYAGFADAQTLFADYGMANPREVIPKAEAAANRALELDPQLSDAVATLGFIRSIYHWQWREGEELFRRAIALNPSNAKARHWFAIDHLLLLGRFEESLAEIQVARMLDPLSLIIHEGNAYLHLMKREYDAGIAMLRQMVEMDPRFGKAHASLARMLAMAGRYDEALEHYAIMESLSGSTPTLVAAVGQIRALAGDRAAGEQALLELDRMARSAYVPCTSFGILHLGLRQEEQALDWFEKAAERHEFQVGTFHLHPLYDSVRKHPRFERILARAGFLR